jgi:hypothetical protein
MSIHLECPGEPLLAPAVGLHNASRPPSRFEQFAPSRAPRGMRLPVLAKLGLDGQPAALRATRPAEAPAADTAPLVLAFGADKETRNHATPRPPKAARMWSARCTDDGPARRGGPALPGRPSLTAIISGAAWVQLTSFALMTVAPVVIIWLNADNEGIYGRAGS